MENVADRLLAFGDAIELKVAGSDKIVNGYYDVLYLSHARAGSAWQGPSWHGTGTENSGILIMPGLGILKIYGE